MPLQTRDGLSPPPPQAPYFDAASGAWILSRYRDVLEAFREPRLAPVGSRGEDQGEERDASGVLLQRREVLDALSGARVGEWQTQLEELADDMLERLPAGRSADLLEDFACPWCLSLALTVTEANPADRRRLGTLGDRIFAGAGLTRRSFLRRRRAAAALAELQAYFATAALPMAQPTFIGISQTLPRLLANGWLALFRQPAEVARLRADPGLMPRAVEELLRYAGIIERLFRKAGADVPLASAPLAAGERVTLVIASANRDPEQFPEPNRVDVSRPATGQLSLGIGRSSCAGARLIRMAFAVSIGTILRKFEHVRVTGMVRWRTAAFCWPASVPVTLRR